MTRAKAKKRNTNAQAIILSFLIDRVGDEFYASQVSRETLVSNSTTHQILERQVKEGMINKRKLGNLSLYSVDKSDRKVKLKKQLKTIQKISDLVKKLKDWSEKIILFGSAALGEDTVKSDIDLLVVSNEKDQVFKTFSKFKNKDRIKLVVKNRLEWVLVKDKDGFFYDEVSRGIVLWDRNDDEKI